jgi:Ca-activated chloride channel family protein
MVSSIPIAYSEIRQNKKMLFGLIGFISGVLGALVADITLIGGSNYFLRIFITALWAGVFTTVISLGLHWAIDVYSRRQNDLMLLIKKSVPMGFLAGAVSGGVAQAVFGLNLFYIPWIDFAFRAICWGICGCVLGACFSYAIPNLGMRRAVIAGSSGGVIGGVGFQLVSLLLPDTLGRMLGIGIMGAALGLCIILVEERSRVAYVEVHWTPDEISFFTLGSTPVFIGAGDSDICVQSVVRHAMSLVIEGGQIIGTDHTKGKKKQLSDGDHINIGKIDMVIRTGIEKMKNY